MINGAQITTLPVESLNFDRTNPRLAEYDISLKASEEEIISMLWEAMDVQELVLSIAASGFFPYERLIVAEESHRYIVIEGNRRLAAVRVLLEPNTVETNGWEIPQITEEAKNKLRKLPVSLASRQDAWRYLGFKHVNGPAKWSSYAKALYIADVHKRYSVPLTDIANQIGDRHQTVQRLFRSMMVLEQAERANVYDREDRFRPRLSLSHLYTGLGYSGISAFLELRDGDNENPVPPEKLEQLGELLVWLFGSKKAKQPPIVESQNPNLRQLDAVIKNREGLASLRSTKDLAMALEISRPAIAVFEEALLAAKRELQRARGYLSTGYDNSEDLLRIAGSVATIADDIYTEMDRKRESEIKKSQGKKPRLVQE